MARFSQKIIHYHNFHEISKNFKEIIIINY